MLALQTGDRVQVPVTAENQNSNCVPWQFESCLKWKSQANKPCRDCLLVHVVWKTKAEGSPSFWCTSGWQYYHYVAELIPLLTSIGYLTDCKVLNCEWYKRLKNHVTLPTARRDCTRVISIYHVHQWSNMKTRIALKMNFNPRVDAQTTQQATPTHNTTPTFYRCLQPQPIWSHCPLESAIYFHLSSQAEYCIIQFPVLPDV